MKNTFFFLLLIFLVGCGKEGLDVKFKTIYSSSGISAGTEKSASSVEAASVVYGQFGDLVGTITPGKVEAKFSSIRYIDRKTTSGQMQTMVELISTNWADNDPKRFADFTNGNTVEMTPEMWGNIDNDGWFVDDNITLRYLGIFPQNFTFEFMLPSQYENKPLNLNCPIPNYVKREGNTVTCQIHFLLWPVNNEGFDYENGKMLNGFVFGETDSTYIVGQNNIANGDITELISMAQPHCVARSGNYTCPVLTPPASGGTKTVTTSINFDSKNIIHHYAGFDNIPYSGDDIFVLRPNFWERFNIKIEQN